MVSFLNCTVNTYGFKTDNRRRSIPLHRKSTAQRHWANILLASEWIICREFQTYLTALILELLLLVSYNLLTYCTLHFRNIWYWKKERFGIGRYCKRSNHVSAVHLRLTSSPQCFTCLISSPLHCLSRFVFKIKMPSDVRVQLINDLADIE